ncbi:MAG: glycosyltransferase family 2 protein [Epsilonproteobacteria bacterium]|nr:MAG: glycosyltransferase family 2 protein [Campylobacterota bacterium]
MQISIIIITKDASNTIKKTLDSVVLFDDVVVYDNDSTDNTADIAKKYTNVNLINGEFVGFGPTKNKAIGFAKHNWVVVLDSDEVIDEKLLHTLKTKHLDKNCVYVLNFHAYYQDTKVKHCGWNNQKIKRVFDKTTTKYNTNLVHEDILTKGLKIEELQGNIKHYSYNSISDFIIKIDRYSTLFANEKVGIKNSTPLKAILSSMFAFFKTYVLRLGFLDGYVGLLISYSRASVVFYKYIKLYELNKKQKDSKNIC